MTQKGQTDVILLDFAKAVNKVPAATTTMVLENPLYAGSNHS